MLSPDGRVVMISGANRGIGLAAANLLADRGYLLSIGARDPAALEAATAHLPAERVHRAVWDAKQPALSQAWADSTAARFGRIDAVLANATVWSDSRDPEWPPRSGHARGCRGAGCVLARRARGPSSCAHRGPRGVPATVVAATGSAAMVVRSTRRRLSSPISRSGCATSPGAMPSSRGWLPECCPWPTSSPVRC